jgi:hypothetical protein
MLVVADGQMHVMPLQGLHQVKADGTAEVLVRTRAEQVLVAAEVALPIFAYVQMHRYQIYVR